jgi:hypothetical protein
MEAQDRPDESTREPEAVAYVVTSAVGLQTGPAAKDYIQLYRGDNETLTRSLERIQQTASTNLEAVLPREWPNLYRFPANATFGQKAAFRAMGGGPQGARHGGLTRSGSEILPDGPAWL